jgi:iron complex outermembrane receptor protein
MLQTNDLQRTESLLLYSKNLNDFGLYALMRYDIEKVNFFGGIRYDIRRENFESLVGSIPETAWQQDYTPVNGSIGLAYHPLKNITVKLNGATGFTTPNEMQLGAERISRYSVTTDYLGSLHYRFEMGNIDLKMEHNMEADFGFLYSSPHVDASVSGFYNIISDYIFLQNTGVTDTILDSLQYIYHNYSYAQDDATLTGGEVMFDIHPAPLKWIDLQLGYSMVRGELNKGANVPYLPSNKFTSALTIHSKKLMWMYNPYFTFAITNYAEQKDTSSFEQVSEAYSLFDIRFGLQLPFAHQVVDVNFAVNNLLNTPYMSYLSEVRTIGIRDMGRNVSIKVRIPFGVKGFSR